MADRSIIMSGPMVKAILDGRKTQTRRVLRPQPIKECASHQKVGHDTGSGAPVFEALDRAGCPIYAYPYPKGCLSPYPRLAFAPGDRLWVRETWNTWGIFDDLAPSKLTGKEGIAYAADMEQPHREACGRLRASMHMPRWASRITLHVTDVRVQRLQEISNDDCLAEGIDANKAGLVTVQGGPAMTAKAAYRDLWDSLNAKRGFGWEQNPWVMAITFSSEVPA